ncbi:hypothetical protein [Lederbergia panacisoli]|uniref:hypothetical protein n=1 Tax=Lederbergia panacisoli TaxID=1255251 RepID=UPI00214BEAD8|nr:hypothetical protein [Lederbergia panacisoli]MCR2821441.1 hypothetical protein [Lederbergia panacisoli]
MIRIDESLGGIDEILARIVEKLSGIDGSLIGIGESLELIVEIGANNLNEKSRGLATFIR